MTLQQQIIERLGVKAQIDAQEEIRRSIDFVKDYMVFARKTALVLGISGGQDSTLAGKLCQMAVDELNDEAGEKNYRFIPVRLPYGDQKDEQDAQDAIAFIGAASTVTINIKAAVDAGTAEFEARTGKKLSDFTKGNRKARERMIAQFEIAAEENGLVIGTDHAAEAITGFYTKFGDGAADLTPLYRLNKRQGRMMLKELGCPEHLYLKTPTADLEEDKPQLADEVALGVTYDDIDDYLEGKPVGDDSRQKIENWYLRTIHKREQPVTVFDRWWKKIDE
ncbi:ammonia-dependent NAD(+) synthetase [Paenibacillus glycanilyticus]|uniref:NH(3)-dependent NAD(+) synthetase n=1 Tax=Paenibacillus glycanilyticus TaxID=126569 RepID=A0ABQ6GEL7_9BACL|nr:ammonia-dependent NAD(+) synthetase [Paenibacillus glycanilyticus]GLX68690.1 NH(3)-dependent NAD(+) synthetase [Paenibacillus glycanilyticus]